jgi:hypothetical protein
MIIAHLDVDGDILELGHWLFQSLRTSIDWE